MLQNGQMIAFGEKLDKLYVKLSLELNVIETSQIFFCRKSQKMVELGIKTRPNGISKMKKGGQLWRSSLPLSSMGLPPPLPPPEVCYCNKSFMGECKWYNARKLKQLQKQKQSLNDHGQLTPLLVCQAMFD